MQENKNRLRLALDDAPETGNVLEPPKEPEAFSVFCVRHAEGGALAPVRSTDWKVARSSPTRREYFVRNRRLAGARPKELITVAEPEVM